MLRRVSELRFHRILTNVVPDSGEGAIVADDVVIAFGLPNGADVGHHFGDLFSAVAFDAVQDAAERPVCFLGFGQRSNQHMNTQRYDHEGKWSYR